MPGYADIGGSWRGLTGGGYANIGGSWRQISAGYQNRGGVWEKVFPNYADYGDTVDMFGQSMITYGRWCYNSTGSSFGSTRTSSSSGSTQVSNENCWLANDTSPRGDALHWFPTVSAIDLRGYNYLAAYVRPWYGYGSRSNYATPFFSVGTSTDSRPDNDTKYILGSRITSTATTQGYACPFYLFVDLTNCTLDSIYLKVGAYLASSVSDNTGCWAYMTSTLINLYKDKSDCDVDPGSTTAQYFTY